MNEPAPTPSNARTFRPLSPAEWVVAAVAILIVVGWIVAWTTTAFSLRGWFAPLSFFGAIGVLAFFVAEILGVDKKLPDGLRGRVLPILSVVPLLGFLLETVMDGWAEFLTIGGSIALAALAARLFWRDYVVRALSTNPRFFDRGAPATATPPVTPAPAGSESPQGSEPPPSSGAATPSPSVSPSVEGGAEAGTSGGRPGESHTPVV